jgi:TolB-like protein
MSLYDELNRRKVIRVFIAYLAFAWLLVQIAETLLPAYGFGDAAIRMLVAGLAVGLVPALVLAWVYDWSPKGLRKTAAATDDPAEMHRQRRQSAGLMVVLVAFAAVGAFYAVRGIETPGLGDNTVAVLPFHTLGAERPDVFTDGMHVGVITRLSGVQAIDVISRTSVLRYRGIFKPLPEIAMELGAAWVLRADVQQSDGVVLVSAQLADARNDRQVWAQEYRRALTASNLFDIQADISRQIIGALQANLQPDEDVRIAQVPTENLDAYRLYREGQSLLEKRTAESTQAALGRFEAALDFDPDYALAWAGIAEASVLAYSWAFDVRDEVLVRADDAISRALELDGDLPDAYQARSSMHYIRRNLPAALRDIDRAIELRPSFAQAYVWRGYYFALLGNAEQGFENTRIAVNLNPLAPEAIGNLAASYAAIELHEEAIAEAERARVLAPDWFNIHLIDGIVFRAAGQPERAVEALDGVSIPWVGAGAEASLAVSLIALGEEERARALLLVIEEMGDLYALALVHAALGSLDQAYEIMDGIEVWGDWPSLSAHNSFGDILDPGGNDPRYQDLLRRINLSWGVEPD